MRQSIMNPYDVEDLRIELTSAIIRRWPIPAISSITNTEEKSSFEVHSFNKKFLVTVEEV